MANRKVNILFKAILRMSPRMVFFMGRRMARNRLAVSFPIQYQARLAAIESGLPQISCPPGNLPPGLLAMSEFYCAEYRGMMDAVLAGRVRLHDHEVDFGALEQINWNHYLPEEGDHQMWRVKLAHMGFLCPMILEGGPEHHAAAAVLATRARSETSMTVPGAFGAYWFPYAASHRLLALGSGLLVARNRGSLPHDTDLALAELLRHNAAFVLDNIEYELNNNHVERNLAALCLYFTYAESVPPQVSARLERDVAGLLDSTILEDGCQVERSPMYQGLTVASLHVIAEATFLSEALREKAKNRAEAASLAFTILCHPDGEVALFNDAWHGEVPRWVGPPAPEGRSVLPQGGYARLSEKNDLCLMDAGPLGPTWNPGHGHADFLSVEITLDGRRVIVDPGTSQYNTGPERARERSAAAHNGPVYTGHEPVEFLGSFKVGRLAQAELLPLDRLSADTICGRFRDSPGQVSRMVRYYPGQGFLIADLWTSTTPLGQVSWLVPATWHLKTNGSDDFVLEVQGARAFIVPLIAKAESSQKMPAYWANRYGHRNPAHEIQLHPKTRDGQQVLLCWIGHVPPPPGSIKDGEILLKDMASFIMKL